MMSRTFEEKLVDVTVEIRRELIRIVKQFRRNRASTDCKRAGLVIFCKQTSNNSLRLLLDRRIFFEHRSLRQREKTIESAKHREWQNDFAIFVPLVRSAQQVADAPNKVRELRMRLSRHRTATLAEIFSDEKRGEQQKEKKVGRKN